MACHSPLLPDEKVLIRASQKQAEGKSQPNVIEMIFRTSLFMSEEKASRTLFCVEYQTSGRAVTFEEQTGGGGRVAVIWSLSVEHGPLDLSGLSWPTLSVEQEQQGTAPLQQFIKVFSQSKGDVGRTNLIYHAIPLIDYISVRQPYRRLPPSQYEQVKAHFQELVDREIVRVSCSHYSSPIVVVPKKDGTIRLCVDYRQLNAKTRKDKLVA
ncbi:hypothetical protein AOLI_G00323390 [Acnodon oligacanthus]